MPMSLYGRGTPPITLGEIGDSYTDRENRLYYVKTDFSTWEMVQRADNPDIANDAAVAKTTACEALAVAKQANAKTGPQGPKGDPGVMGPPGFGVVTPTTPNRAFGSVFQPNVNRAVFVNFSVSITCPHPSEGKIELLSDAVNPPTTVRATSMLSTVGGNPGVGQATQKTTHTLSCIVPQGHYVQIRTTVVSGAPTFAIINQTEESLG